MTVADLVAGIAGLALAVSISVLVHELAHLVAARLLGLPVRRISVGFGPEIACANWGGLELRLGAIPAGGYVAFDDRDSRWSEAALGRVLMYAAGPLASLLMALVLLAGAVTLSEPSTGFCDALRAALIMLGELIASVARGLAGIRTDLNGICDLAGPVEVVTIGARVMAGGPVLYLGMVGILSAGIGLFNLLPIPVLDGGQMIRGLIEAATGARLSGRVLKLWTSVGMTMVILIGGLALLGDLVCT